MILSRKYRVLVICDYRAKYAVIHTSSMKEEYVFVCAILNFEIERE